MIGRNALNRHVKVSPESDTAPKKIEEDVSVEVTKKPIPETTPTPVKLWPPETVFKFDCAGRTFKITFASLSRCPDSLLYNLVTQHETDSASVMFFDRNEDAFASILQFYRSGYVDKPKSISDDAWEDEVIFFRTHELLRDLLSEPSKELRPSKGCRRHLWNLLEDPASSVAARIISIVTLLVVCIAIGAQVVSTLYDRNFDKSAAEYDTIEQVCVVYFTVEYILRFIACAKPKRFMMSLENVIDLLACVPFYATIGVTNKGPDFAVVKVFRLIRVFRVLKLGKHATGMNLLVSTLKASYDTLLILLFFLLVGILIFASFLYYAETGRDGEGLDGRPVFTSIPQTMYWAAVTMTTLGYGDLYPSTTVGFWIASAAAIFGVLVIALPMSVIGSTFSEQHQLVKAKARTTVVKEKIAKEKAEQNIPGRAQISGSGMSRVVATADTAEQQGPLLTQQTGSSIDIDNLTKQLASKIAKQNALHNEEMQQLFVKYQNEMSTLQCVIKALTKDVEALRLAANAPPTLAANASAAPASAQPAPRKKVLKKKSLRKPAQAPAAAEVARGND